MDKDNVSIITTLVCDTNTIVSADCPPTVSITSSASPPYKAGDQLTCAYDEGTPPEEDYPIYEWSGFNGGSLFSVTSDTVTLLTGEFCLLCTVTVQAQKTKEAPFNCSGSHFVCDSASGKYRKHEAQLPQRNSASAAHMEGKLSPPAHSRSAPLATPMRMFESETRNKRTSSVPSAKRTL